MLRSIIFASILFLYTTQAKSQSKLICRQLTTQQGLMHGYINGITQDKNRFIWLAGDEGLQRYDGFEFTNYYHNYNLPKHTFPDGRLGNVEVDKKNNVWISSSNNGFSIYKPFNNSVKYYSNNSKILASTKITGKGDFYFLNDSVTYLVYQDVYLKLLNDSIVYINNYSKTSALTNYYFGYIAADKNGNLWLSNKEGLWFLDTKTNTLFNKNNSPEINEITNKIIALASSDNALQFPSFYFIFIDHQNNLWISVFNYGTFKYNLSTKQLEQVAFINTPKNKQDNTVIDIIEDNDQNLWIATFTNGLYKYNSINKNFNHYLHNPLDEQSIASNVISKLFKDADGNIWVACRNNKISIFNPSFNVIQKTYLDITNTPTAICVAKDASIWAADESNLYKINSSLEVIEKYKHTKNNIDKGPGKHVAFLAESTNSKEIYIGKENCFAIFNKANKQIDFFEDIAELNTLPIIKVTEKQDGNLYILKWPSPNNFLLFNRYKRSLTTLVLPLQEKIPFEVFDVIQKDINNAYLLSNKGLLHLNIKNNNLTIINKYYEARRGVLIENKIYALSESNGILIYDLITNSIKKITKLNGLPTNNNRQIIYDDHNNCWIASTQGLIKWNLTSNTFTTFREEQGIAPNLSIYAGSLAEYMDGSILFSNFNSNCISFISAKNKFTTQSLPVEIIHCKTGNTILSPQEYLQKVYVNHNHNILQINFGVINYNNYNTKYQYMLEGYDDGWKDGKLRFANYTNLPHGNYKFKVRASTENNNWNNATTISVYVSQAFYNAWWFYIIIGLIIATALWLYYQSRIKRIVELQNLRNNISRDLHDEVGSTLSSISILSSSVINNIKAEPTKALEWIHQIGADAQKMLNVMDDIVWSINPKVDSLESIVQKMREVAFKISDATDISIQFNCTSDMNNVALPMLTKRNFYLIYKEALNNAIKHSACKHIDISIERIKNKFLLTITDDGKGFDINTAFNRNGLRNMKQRAEEIKSTIQFITAQNKGTTIQLHLQV